VPPRETAIGALAHYVSHADPRHYQPTNITFGIMPPPDATPSRRLKKEERKTATSTRALAALDEWIGIASTARAEARALHGQP
jgi:methylenetetrahydrofolate--tRNA-(uracil-5-)-methyltransferase